MVDSDGEDYVHMVMEYGVRDEHERSDDDEEDTEAIAYTCQYEVDNDAATQKVLDVSMENCFFCSQKKRRTWLSNHTHTPDLYIPYQDLLVELAQAFGESVSEETLVALVNQYHDDLVGQHGKDVMMKLMADAKYNLQSLARGQIPGDLLAIEKDIVSRKALDRVLDVSCVCL